MAMSVDDNKVMAHVETPMPAQRTNKAPNQPLPLWAPRMMTTRDQQAEVSQ